MKSKTNNIKVRRIGRKRKALPPHTWEAHPTANQGEVNKTLIIAVVTILAIVGLATLLFFSDTFVGQASFHDLDTVTIDPQTFGIFPNEPATFEVGETQSVPIIANFGAQNAASFDIILTYDNNVFDVVCDLNNVFEKLDLTYSEYVVDKSASCNDGEIHLSYMIIPLMDGSADLTGKVILAELEFTATQEIQDTLITSNDGNNDFSEAVDSPENIIMNWNQSVPFDIILGPVACEKIMQEGCYPIGEKFELGGPIGDLYCSNSVGGDNNFGVCANLNCKNNLKNLMGQANDIKPLIKGDGEVPYCTFETLDDQDSCPSFPVQKICSPGDLFFKEIWPADATDEGVCFTEDYIDVILSECNGAEFFCEARTMFGFDECGIGQGDCFNNDDLCADGLVCGGTDESYADGITFCQEEVCMGAVSYWDFDDGTALDTIGNNNAAVSEATSINAGKVGKAMAFGAQPFGCKTNCDSASLISTPAMSFKDSMSICFWANPDTIDVKEMVLHGTVGTGAFEVYQNNNMVTLRGGTGELAVDSLAVLTEDTWTHICAVVDETSGSIYIDGQFSVSGTIGAPNIDSLPIYIGAYSNNWYGFDGGIDEVAVFDKALTIEEVETIYDNTMGGEKYCNIEVDTSCTADADCAAGEDCLWGQCVPIVDCGDEDGDGVCNDDDCAPTDTLVWQEIIGYLDEDGDGYGNLTTSEEVCSGATLLDTHVTTSTDCDDDDPLVWQEMTAYQDMDNDGFGFDLSEASQVCTDGNLPELFASNQNDCNDGNESITECKPLGLICVDGACVGAPIVIEDLTCIDIGDCAVGLYCIETVCTNVTGKVILSEGDFVDGTYNTKTLAIEGFPDTPFNVFTILFGPNNETLVSESRVVNGLANTQEITTSITFIDEDVTVSRKLVNVYDKLPGQGWTVHGKLETYYD